MKRFIVYGQIPDGTELEKLAKHISNAVSTFEKKHGSIEEIDVQIAITKDEEENQVFTDARGIGFHPAKPTQEEDED